MKGKLFRPKLRKYNKNLAKKAPVMTNILSEEQADEIVAYYKQKYKKEMENATRMATQRS